MLTYLSIAGVSYLQIFFLEGSTVNPVGHIIVFHLKRLFC